MSGSTLPAHRGQRTAATTAKRTVDAQPLLSHEAVEAESDEQLLARGAAYAREYDRIKDNETTLLRNIAVVLVELRRRCPDAEGRPDWHGRSGAYRRLAADLYARAGVGQDSQVQSAVRYHIGNHLREVVGAEELAQYNLKPEGPVQRSSTARQARAAIVTMARHELTAAQSATAQPKAKKQSKKADAEPPAAPTGSLVGDHIRLGAGARSILEQLSTDVIDGMTDGQRARLDAELEAIQKSVAKLRRHTRKRSSEA